MTNLETFRQLLTAAGQGALAEAAALAPTEAGFLACFETLRKHCPAELAKALEAEPKAKASFDALSYSNRSWHVLQVTSAKTDETRQRRIAKSIEMLREGRSPR